MSIRNVPENVRDTLAARAAQRGQSLQEYLLNMLVEHAGRPSMAELMAQIRARKAGTESRVSVADILLAKDEDRR
jgi:plasmid stability protein